MEWWTVWIGFTRLVSCSTRWTVWIVLQLAILVGMMWGRWTVWIVLQLAILVGMMWGTTWWGTLGVLCKFVAAVVMMFYIKTYADRTGWSRTSFTQLVSFSTTGQIWIWLPYSQLNVEVVCIWLCWQESGLTGLMLHILCLAWLHEWWRKCHGEKIQGTCFDLVHSVDQKHKSRVDEMRGEVTDKDDQPDLDHIGSVVQMLGEGDELNKSKADDAKMTEKKKEVMDRLGAEGWKTKDYKALFTTLQYIHAPARSQQVTWHGLLKKRHPWLPDFSKKPGGKKPAKPADARDKSPGRQPVDSESENSSDSE